MAKLRVYELAKDLNMTNKALLNKLKELDIDAKSHMSSLEGSAIKQIKASLFDKSRQKEDLKVRPSVIRRRKKKTVRDPDAKSQERPVDSAALEMDVHKTEDATDRRESAIDTPGAPPVAAEQKIVAKESAAVPESPEVSKPQKTSLTKKKKSEPAKIIKPVKAALPPEPESVKPTPAPKPVDTKTKQKSAGVSDQTPASAVADDQKESEKTSPPAEEKNLKDDTAQEVPSTFATDKEAETTELESQKSDVTREESSTPETEEAKSSKKKKKKKKSTPAKIVKKADPLVLENIRKTKAEEEKRDMGAERIARPAASTRPGAVANGPDAGVPFIPEEPDPGFRKKDRRKDEGPNDSFDGKKKETQKEISG